MKPGSSPLSFFPFSLFGFFECFEKITFILNFIVKSVNDVKRKKKKLYRIYMQLPNQCRFQSMG